MNDLNSITNDAKFLLSSMYKIYLEKRSTGVSKEQALYFGDVVDIHKNIMPEWLVDDVEFTCFELLNHGLISGQLADSTIYFVRLTTKSVAALETTFADKVDSVLEYAAKIKNAIPFF